MLPLPSIHYIPQSYNAEWTLSPPPLFSSGSSEGSLRCTIINSTDPPSHDRLSKLWQIPVGILSIFLSHVLRLMHESTASIRANGCNSHMNDIQASYRPLPTYLHSSRPTCVRFSAYPYQIDLIISLPRAAAAEQSRYCSFPLSPDQKRKCRGNSSPSCDR